MGLFDNSLSSFSAEKNPRLIYGTSAALSALNDGLTARQNIANNILQTAGVGGSNLVRQGRPDVVQSLSRYNERRDIQNEADAMNKYNVGLYSRGTPANQDFMAMLENMIKKTALGLNR